MSGQRQTRQQYEAANNAANDLDGHSSSPVKQCSFKSFNLMFPEGRQAAPYASLDRYSKDLRSHAEYDNEQNQYPVEIMRHHIIPYNVLRNFWNTMLAKEDLGAGRGPAEALLKKMATNVHEYQTNMDPTDRRKLGTLLDDICTGTIRHSNDAASHDSMDNLAQLYQWLPGNLFVGPKGRSDDPKDGFELKAKVVVLHRDFERLQTAYDNIQKYLNSPTKPATAIVFLSQIADRKSTFDLNPANWVSKGGAYELHTP